MNKEYAQKLKDPRWIRRRWEILQLDNSRCHECSFTPANERYRMRHITDLRRYLVVHHLYYVKAVEPWDYPDEALMTLCNVCHEKIHTGFEFSSLICDWKLQT